MMCILSLRLSNLVFCFNFCFHRCSKRRRYVAVRCSLYNVQRCCDDIFLCSVIVLVIEMQCSGFDAHVNTAFRLKLKDFFAIVEIQVITIAQTFLPPKMSVMYELEWSSLWCGVYASTDSAFSIPYFHGAVYLNMGSVSNGLQNVVPQKVSGAYVG